KILTEKLRNSDDLVSRVSEDANQAIAIARVDVARQRSPERETTLFYVTPQHLIVKASFDPNQFSSFVLYRRNEGDANDKFRAITGHLDSPEHTDTSVASGQAYVYKFRAYRSASDADFVESYPYTMRVPRVKEMAAERSIRIQCV